MCRMLAVRGPSGAEVRDTLLRFREQGRQSGTGPETERHHRDGWGMAAFGAGGERLLVRRPARVADDPSYETAVDVVAGFAQPLVIVHLRNASVGTLTRFNTHPFTDGRWVFAHNGTVRDPDVLGIPASECEGGTDSERVFRLLSKRLAKGEPPVSAMRATADDIERRTQFTSLTCLLTDGRTLYGMRRMGSDLADCGTKECQAEYYTLAWARKGPVTVVTQEPTHLGDLGAWRALPNNGALVWEPGTDPRIDEGVARVAAQPTMRPK